jgi:WD40 repeat protein
MELHGGFVEVWSVESGGQIARWECGDIAAMANGVESGDLVVASTHGPVNVWTVGRENPRTMMVGSGEQAIATAVTRDAQTIVRAFADGRLECDRLAGGRLRRNMLRPPVSAFYDEPIRRLVITADGQKVISSEVGAIRLWNLAPPASDMRSAEDGSSILSMTPDGRYLIVQTGDGTVACRDEMTGTMVTLEGLLAPFGSPDITSDGAWAVYQAADGRRMIWDTSTGAHVVSLTDSYGAPAITCDSRVVYRRRTNAEGGGLWTLPLKPHVNLEAARPVRFGDVDSSDTVALAVVPNSARVIIIVTTGAFSWNLDEPAPSRVLIRDGWPPLSAVRANERWLLACQWEHAEVWDMHSASKVLDLDFAPISTAAFTPSGRGLLIATGRLLTLWDINRGLTVARFHADTPIRAVACPSDTSFIAASTDGRVHRLDLRDAPVANAAVQETQPRGSRRV